MSLVPILVAQTRRGKRVYDIASPLLRDRLVSLGSVIPGDEGTDLVPVRLLFLASDTLERDSSFYLGSPSGFGTAGLAIREASRPPRQRSLLRRPNRQRRGGGDKRKGGCPATCSDYVPAAPFGGGQKQESDDTQAREMPCLSEQLTCLFAQHPERSREENVILSGTSP